ncbi:MAG TPA: hypothetical protein VG297_04765 [Bryobacteraceae bacterium]|jgi:hypothetical protein|nr:hypothetical protein [Bryobacteraceae bacterium]
MRGLGGAGHASLLGMLICLVPAVVGAWFAFRPRERLLSLMRPLTLGAVFAALCNLALAIANGFVAIGTMKTLDLAGVRTVGSVFSEGLAPVVVSFASLAVAWFFVAMGTRKD